jgi:hypothetical protein
MTSETTALLCHVTCGQGLGRLHRTILEERHAATPVHYDSRFLRCRFGVVLNVTAERR